MQKVPVKSEPASVPSPEHTVTPPTPWGTPLGERVDKSGRRKLCSSLEVHGDCPVLVLCRWRRYGPHWWPCTRRSIAIRISELDTVAAAIEQVRARRRLPEAKS
jgi:hypothetical protein